MRHAPMRRNSSASANARARSRKPAELALALALAFAATPAAAFGEVEEGRDIAKRWCAECHQVAPDANATDVAPGFPAIAKDPAYTDARLRGWLSDPHPPMPKLQLSRREIDALVAYVRSLETE